MRTQTVLVTGGAGFIGSTLVDRLLAEGRRVVAVDDLSTGSLANLEDARRDTAGQFEFQRADVVRGGLDAVVERHRPEVVVHLAARASGAASIQDPVGDAMVNVVGTINVLEACRRFGVSKVVMATSGGAVATDAELDRLPLDETWDGPGLSPHAAAERAAEEYLRTYGSVYGLRWTVLAMSNVYGPRQRSGDGAGVVATFVDAMLQGRPTTMHGDGQATRDFVYVDDVVHALALAMERGDDERFCVGTGQRTSIDRLFAALAAATDHRRDPVFADARTGDARHASVDARAAAHGLGWKPWTSLAEGLAATLRWADTRA
jgi:UDP-glucose 4-epimerase